MNGDIKRLRFYLPQAIYDRLGYGTKIRAIRQPDDASSVSWLLQTGQPTAERIDGRLLWCALGKQSLEVSDAPSTAGMEPFGKSPADFLYDNGTVMVVALRSNFAAMKVIRKWTAEPSGPDILGGHSVEVPDKEAVAAYAPELPAAPPLPVPIEPVPIEPASIDEAAIRAALDTLNRVLAACPWLRVERVAATGRLRLTGKIE